MKTILITGSLGLVGSEAVKFFIEKNWRIVGLDNNMRSYFFGVEKTENILTLDVDIRNEQAINQLFKDTKFDAIIHAAAQPSHDWAKNEPLTDFDINARATLILLEATRKYCPEAVFVHVSTDKVYGENMTVKPLKIIDLDNGGVETEEPGLVEHKTRYHAVFPFKEDLGLDFAGQRSLFGCSKAAADMYAQEYANYFGLKVGIFRPGCITGSQHKGAEYHGFMSYLVKCVKEGITYHIFGHQGKQVRDQIHAYDLVNAFYHFIENPKPGAVYNIGGGPDRSLSVIEALEMVSKELDKPFTIEFHEGRKGDRVWDVHDISKFRADYPDWDFKYSLEDIIKDLCQK